MPTHNATAITKSLTSTVTKVKLPTSAPSEPTRWTSTAALDDSNKSTRSSKLVSFSEGRSSTTLGNSSTVVKPKTSKAPALTTQPNLEPPSVSSTSIVPGGPGKHFPSPKNSTAMTKLQTSTSFVYTSAITQGKSRFSFPKRPTSSVSVRPSTSANPGTQSSFRSTYRATTSFRQGKSKSPSTGGLASVTTRLTGDSLFKNISHGSDRPKTAIEPTPYKVIPSVIKCRCKGNPMIDPSCCRAVYKTVTKVEPTTKPIIIPVPDPTTIYGGKLTVTKDVWKTITDTKTFTKEKWGTCRTTEIDYKTQTLCKAPKPTYDAPPHVIGRPEEPYHDGPDGWDVPSDVSVPDACSPGNSCLPDHGYCHTKCSDYFEGCIEEQCHADFFRCYDDCLWEDTHDRTDHLGYPEIVQPGDYLKQVKECHKGCKSKDPECHKDCDKKYTGHTLGAVDNMECHQSCRAGLNEFKCHSECDRLESPDWKATQSNEATCAWGYSCQQNREKSPRPYPPQSSEPHKYHPTPAPSGRQPEPSQQYPPTVPAPPGQLPEPPNRYPVPTPPPARQPKSSGQDSHTAPLASPIPPAPSRSYPMPPGQQLPTLESSPLASIPGQDPSQALPAPPSPPAAMPPYWCTGAVHKCHPRHRNGTAPAIVIKSQGATIRPLSMTVRERLRTMRAGCKLDNRENAENMALGVLRMGYDVVLATIEVAIINVVTCVIAFLVIAFIMTILSVQPRGLLFT